MFAELLSGIFCPPGLSAVVIPDKGAVDLRVGQKPVFLRAAVNIAAVAPHFRKERDVCAHLLRLSAGVHFLFKIFFQGAAGRDLQQGNL